VRETVVAKFELALEGTSPVDQIYLVGPLKQYLAEDISLRIQRSNCNNIGLTDNVALFVRSPMFLDLGYSSGHVPFKMKPVTFHFFAFCGKVDHYVSAWQVLKKMYFGTFWARTK